MTVLHVAFFSKNRPHAQFKLSDEPLSAHTDICVPEHDITSFFQAVIGGEHYQFEKFL
jgi:hypothetical protein